MATKEEIIQALLDEAGKAHTREHFEDLCSRIETLRDLQIESQ